MGCEHGVLLRTRKHTGLLAEAGIMQNCVTADGFLQVIQQCEDHELCKVFDLLLPKGDIQPAVLQEQQPYT